MGANWAWAATLRHSKPNGYVRQILPRRPDLKLIVTSATIDAERFAQHFAGRQGPAPVIQVSGRLYPVEVRWRPFEESRDFDLNDAIADAVDELWREGPGDILVFLPGEREIREAADHLRKHLSHQPAHRQAQILPLFARLSEAEQDRVFEPGDGRRIVLATNVAETSLTVPGIRYVIDSGLARVKRYSYRNKVEQLQVEPISQAAAQQRSGRCGRVANGVCIRLYDEKDFAGRPRFTDPEILRSSLAGVILRMKALGLGQVEDFPFLEPPPRKAIADGYAAASVGWVGLGSWASRRCASASASSVSIGLSGSFWSSRMPGTSVMKMSLSACKATAVLVATSSIVRLKASPVGEKPKGDSSTIAPVSMARWMAPASTRRTTPLCMKSTPSTIPTGRAVRKLPEITRTVELAMGVLGRPWEKAASISKRN